MICPRCQNSDASFFYEGSKGWYCRRCISFKRQLLLEEMVVPPLEEISDDASDYLLKYPLTSKQKEISRLCAQTIQHQDVLIKAVCGAGKTEIVVETIAQALLKGQKVGIAIARRQVVLELASRLQQIFPLAKVIAVAQGYTSILDGDCIVATTHQCYRYPFSFDCLIVDEPDAFPYKGNKVLQGIVRNSAKGHMVYLTATPDEELMELVNSKKMAMFCLNERPHGYPLIIPVVKIMPMMVMCFYLLWWIKSRNKKQCIIFVPTIKHSIWVRRLVASITTVRRLCSLTENKDKIIQRFREKRYQCLVATTVLERGITIEGIDVCVFLSNHGVFDEASLIQMSGRVGRSFKHYGGDCLFLSSEQSDVVNRCVMSLKEANGETVSMVSSRNR